MTPSACPLLLLLSLSGGALCSPFLHHAHNNNNNKVRQDGDFYSDRAAMLQTEASSFLGAELSLSVPESVANDLLMLSKISELDRGFQDSFYPPSQSFFNSKPQIEASEVFAFIRDMPKGAALHTHDIAIATIDWVVADITYRDNLYMCEDLATGDVHFGWFLGAPTVPSPSCTSALWTRVIDRRQEVGAVAFDATLKSLMVINVPDPATTYPDLNSVWSAFGSALGTISEVIGHEPAFRDYFRRALEEFHMDNVQHLEVRTVLPDEICVADLPEDPNVPCQFLTQLEVAAVFQDVADMFSAEHVGDTCGVSMIFAPTRRVTPETVDAYLVLARRLLDLFPGFFVGFDLVSQEDKGRPLIDFADSIINATIDTPDLQFFFHAGETNWQGQSTDINLVDALLLGTKRIGHGYAIVKHPEAKRLALERNVPLEVCPISNQVLGLVSDLRNHPAAVLIQEGFPVVISCDDPGTWDSFALSFDFYEAFMSLAGRDMDLRLLKRLAFDSVVYSALPAEAKDQCTQLLQSKWDGYMGTFWKKDDAEISVVEK